MASISSDKAGFRRLLFTQGKRYTIHLGSIPIKTAREIKTRVEYIQAALSNNHPLDGMTALWLNGIDDKLHAKLAKCGLVPARSAQRCTRLADLIDDIHRRNTTWKSHTRDNHKAARRVMIAYFGNNRDVTTITELQAEEFREHLRKHSSENTVRRRCSYARQYFKVFSKKLGIENPFGNMKKLIVEGDPSKFFFIDTALSQQILKAMPDAEWRLIFGLCRWGGFRCPSEHVALRWKDIDWKNMRINLNAPKTGLRTLPVFPELAPLLKAMMHKGERVFPDYQRYINLGTVFKKLLTKAGIPLWPKIFQNLRSTRETELLEKFPLHVVCSWIGNTERVARNHYLQTTEEHFLKATQNPTQSVPETTREYKQAVSTFAKNSVGFSNLLVLSAAKSLPIGIEPTRKPSVYHKVFLAPTRRATQKKQPTAFRGTVG